MKKATCRTMAVFLTALCSLTGLNTAMAASAREKTKDFIDDAASVLKKSIDQVGDTLSDVQNYLDNYAWRGLIQDEATSDAATLKHLQLNGHSRSVAVKPGERIEGIVECSIDREKCSSLKLYHVLVGIKGLGAQVVVGSELGLTGGESLERFELIAPSQPGVYEVRFKTVTGLFDKNMLREWVDKQGNEPGPSTTVGVIVVRS